MVDDRPENTGSLPDSDRPKRAPPTIDLTGDRGDHRDTRRPSDAAPPEAEAEAPSASPVAPPPAPVSPWIVAPVSGAVAAALVIGVGWMLGWPAIQPAAPPAPQLNAAAIDDLTARIAGLETKVSKPAAPVADPAAAARMEALEKSLAALRGELATTRAQGEKLASAINEVKSAPRADGAPAPDLSAIDERIAKIESAVRAQAAEIAQQASKIADSKAADAKPADDLPLRRVVAAALLDVLVRIGDPYQAALASAKALSPNADALKPLDQFAASGVPNAAQTVGRVADAGAETVAGGAAGHRHDRFGHRRAPAGRCGKTGQDRAHRHVRQRSRRRGGADDGSGAAQRFQRSPARIEDAGAGRSRGGASLAGQGRRARCGAGRVPSIRD